jgi:hypothetical protein
MHVTSLYALFIAIFTKHEKMTCDVTSIAQQSLVHEIPQKSNDYFNN